MLSALVSHFSFMDFPASWFSDQLSATFRALVNSSCPLFNFLRRLSPATTFGANHTSAAAVVLVIVAVPGFLYLKKNKTKPPYYAARRSRQYLTFDPPVTGHIGAIVPHPDAAYAEEVQVQEALLASLYYTAPSTKYASSPSNVGQQQLKNFCGICLDNKERCQMFKNDRCSHSFCYDCTTKYVMSRIDQRATVIGCPGVRCNAALDFTACRMMITKDALVQWDESVCQSMILDSQKLYCPFHDCSALLVNDYGTSIQKVKCPVCKRSLCAACRVPWHPEFTCKEFQKLNAEKGDKEEGMVKILAKKKNWQKCPNCSIFVEKTEGCIHMICWCGYGFCYRCAAKWTPTHFCPK